MCSSLQPHLISHLDRATSCAQLRQLPLGGHEDGEVGERTLEYERARPGSGERVKARRPDLHEPG